MTDPAKSLAMRWQAHLASTSLDFRGLLIEAVAAHEGWEESAIALVDEAIMPIIEEMLADTENEMEYKV